MRPTPLITVVAATLLFVGCGSGDTTETPRPTTSPSPAGSPSASEDPSPSETPDATATPSASPTADTSPDTATPEITRFEVPGRLTCPDPVSEMVTIRFRVVRANQVRFDLDGQPLSSRGFPNKGTALFDLPCDGKNHALTLLAFTQGSDEVAAQATKVVRAPRS
ncbi:MAG: hypothetical protein WEA10_02930 [Actinomycetota bacterium]